jgi:hypothetical protein
MKKLILILTLILSCASAKASLDNQQFGKFRDWAERCGFIYQGIVIKFGIQCYAFINSKTESLALAPLSSDTPDEAINALIASNLAYRDAAAVADAPTNNTTTTPAAITASHTEEEEEGSFPGPNATIEQDNACRAAREYLDSAAFSRKELIEQLKFSGYSASDAAYAVNRVYRK